ncbi:MAG: transaldolase [Formivibrio sp.]|nr:transaldolase [Formivibrio sp.]
MSNQISRLKAIGTYGQQVWLDNLSRHLIESGHLARLIAEDGVAGVTSNPAIFQQAFAKDPAYIAAKAALPADMTDPEARFEALALSDIQASCDIFRTVYDHSAGKQGYVSFEVSPHLAHDAAGTLAAAKRLWSKIDRPNVMIKIPATSAGLIAIRQATASGINVNVTLVFSQSQVEAVAHAYIAGLQDRLAAGLPVSGIRSVSSVFISRVDAKLDPQLPESLRGKVSIASAKVAYAAWQRRWGPEGSEFAALAAAGAMPQILLWASTGVKNPAYSDVLYIESLIGPNTVNTIPEAPLEAFRDHGNAAATLALDVASAQAVLDALPALKLDLNQIGEILQQEGLAQFEQAFEKLVESAR